MLKLSRLKSIKVFMDNIRWDLTPEELFKPRFVRSAKDCDKIQETQGFMFYIDYLDDALGLMVMKTYELRSKTVGEIEDAPKELLLSAVRREGVKDVTGMYPIDDSVKKWLMKGLGLL